MKKAREEWVRQSLMKSMIEQLGYPLHELVQEISLSNIEHLRDEKKLPLRRLDLVCISRNVHKDFALYPLLIVECKAHKLCDKAFNQLCGYNSWVKAPFVAMSNFHQTIMGAYHAQEGRYRLVNRMMGYSELKGLIG